jgi:hypothetical protein
VLFTIHLNAKRFILGEGQWLGRVTEKMVTALLGHFDALVSAGSLPKISLHHLNREIIIESLVLPEPFKIARSEHRGAVAKRGGVES